MEKKLRTAWTVAGILGVLLVIALVLLISDHKTISDLKNPASQSITAQQDVIRADCSATDADSKARCADDLQKMSDLLSEFSKGLPAAHAEQGVSGGVSNVQTQPFTITKQK